jgi:hypothetical protein
MPSDRPHARYPLAATVEIHQPSLPGTVLAELHNISLSGCYVRTPRAIAEHTRVRLVLHTGDLKADLWGVVTRQGPNGFGIQFTNGSTVEDWKSLQSIVERLASLGSQKSQATSAGRD